MGYRIRRVDHNQTKIVSKLRRMGAKVAILSSLGNGIPDLLISFPFTNGWTALIEIKDGSKPASQQKLTPDEQAFHSSWPGNLYIIRSEKDVDELIKKIMEMIE